MDGGAKRGRGRPRDEGLVERRREEILAAATEVFAERTIRGTDVQEIADRIGVGKGTIYRYFPSKDELFLATVTRGMDALRERIDEVLHDDLPPREKLERLFRTFLGFFDGRPELVEVLVQERAEFRERGRLTFFDYYDAISVEDDWFEEQLRDAGILRRDSRDRPFKDAVRPYSAS